MEIRRVQKTGTSTMTVSLPKEWVEMHGLKAGDPVTMISLPDGTISVDPRSEIRKEALRRQIWIDPKEAEEHLTRKLIGAYLAGFNIIEVRSKVRMDHDMKRAIKDFSRLVIGPEVIEETSNTITLHDLSDPVELPQERCVRRMHLIVSSMHREISEAFTPLDVSLAKDIVDRDGDVDRLYWMAVKQYNLILKDRKLSEKIGVDIFESMNLVLVARGVERIGDHAEKVARNIIAAEQQGIELQRVEDLRKLSASALSVLDRAMESFFLKNIKSANAAIDSGDEVVQRAERLSEEVRAKHSPSAIIYSSIVDSLVRVTMYAMDIAEIAINAAMKLPEP